MTETTTVVASIIGAAVGIVGVLGLMLRILGTNVASVSQKTLVSGRDFAPIRGIRGVISARTPATEAPDELRDSEGQQISPNVLFPRTGGPCRLLPARNPAWLSGPVGQATSRCRLRSRFCRINPMRCRLAASTDKATVRAKPSAPWLRTRSSPRCSNPLMADSIAGCARRAATNDSFSSRSRSALERYPLPGNALTSSSASRRTRLSRL